ncbi:MAG: hypothetical protein PUB03_06095 [bacterium]|nr:hypothetical protein [bacterium]
MEAVGRIKEASLDINTIGLYDADLERERIENGIRSVSFKAGIERGIEQGSTKERISIISAMLNNGMSQEEVTRMTGIPIKEVKSVKL